LAGFDAFVDARDHGGGKPAAVAYLGAAEELGVEPERIVFLDDMPMCIDGARAVGMTAVLVDPTRREVAFDRVRELAGISRPSEAHRLVAGAEAAYRSQDLERIMALFDPDISIQWNGEQVALGHDESRRFHTERLGIGGAERGGLRLRTTLRAAQGDTITLEVESSRERRDGPPERSRAGVFVATRRGLIVELHCYQHRLAG
jgi:hypothetical protein